MTNPICRAAILSLTAGLTLAGSGVVGAEKPAAPSAGHVAAHGAGREPDDALTLHLRDVDLVHVFFVLNDLTSQSFVIASDVKGKVSVDLEQVTPEEALAAMSSAGLVVGSGGLHRVSRAGSPPAAAAPSQASYTGKTISMSLENVELANVLCALGRSLQPMIEVRTERGAFPAPADQSSPSKVLVPHDLQVRMSIFSSDLPWDQVFEGLVSSAGLISVLDGDRRLVGPGPEASVRTQPGAVDACEIPSERSPHAPVYHNLSDLDAADLKLVGLARKGDAWKAYAYSSSRQILSLQTGQKLRDARVTDVGPTGVAITTNAGRVLNVPLRP